MEKHSHHRSAVELRDFDQDGLQAPPLQAELGFGRPAPSRPFSWRRRGGYEVSTKGDSRFSAMVARLADGRTIEQHYQCDVKGYEPGGTNWRLGKGRPPRNPGTDTWGAYLGLWRAWVALNPAAIAELRSAARRHGGILSDCFATTPVNQAAALAAILNETSAAAPPPAVWNKRHGNAPAGAVYIGRPSKWGNPFSHLPGTLAAHRVESRAAAVAAYEQWLLQQPDLMRAAALELRGRDLVCWCTPAACHGDVLLRVSNEDYSFDHN